MIRLFVKQSQPFHLQWINQSSRERFFPQIRMVYRYRRCFTTETIAPNFAIPQQCVIALWRYRAFFIIYDFWGLSFIYYSLKKGKKKRIKLQEFVNDVSRYTFLCGLEIHSVWCTVARLRIGVFLSIVNGEWVIPKISMCISTASLSALSYHNQDDDAPLERFRSIGMSSFWFCHWNTFSSEFDCVTVALIVYFLPSPEMKESQSYGKILTFITCQLLQNNNAS